MANSTYLFACGHPQEEAGPLRLWQAILDTDILSPQQQQQEENPDGHGPPTKLAHLPCPACRDAGPNFYKNHLAYLFLSSYSSSSSSSSSSSTAPLLAEMAQLLWEFLSSDGGDQEQEQDEDEDEDLVRWTHVLLLRGPHPYTPLLLTPSQYEGPFLSAVLRACGFASLRRVTAAAAPHALLPPRNRGVLRDPEAAREWIDGVLAEGVMLVEWDGVGNGEDGGEDGVGGMGGMGGLGLVRTVQDYERLREDYAAQLRVCDALDRAYEVLDEAREAAEGQMGGVGLGTQEKRELMRRVVRACLGVRKEALDLRKFREG
ncbi:hypothetical protein F5X96DRAFT_693293 [Biscogniauxia mediterranea]|nr:hypothetical protein F5X96DRAFT_693293 [Biscogniauxia mediterranea]